jgi:D-alanyl-D-alanine carboxypeptidase
MNMQPARSVIDRRKLLVGVSLASVVPLVPGRMTLAHSTSVASPVASPEAVDWDGLSARIGDLLDTKGIPGAIVSIDIPGQARWERGFGVSDVATGAEMNIADHFRIGSVTKSMTATLVLQLVREGLLSLDDPVQDLAPDLEHAAGVTVRHLLSMTSGVFDILEDESFLPGVIADPLRVWSPAELVAVANAHEPEFAPGTDMRYSNTNYIVLGQIVEEVTGSEISRLLDERIFQPLGMAQTSLPGTPDLPAPFSHGYLDPAVPGILGVATPEGTAAGQLPDYTEVDPSVGWAAGGIVSTASDLHLWLAELLSGTLIGEDLQRERMTFRSGASEGGMDYGLGVARFGEVVGHDGSFIGFQTLIGRSPSGLSIVAMVNLEPTADRDGVASEIALACFEALS